MSPTQLASRREEREFRKVLPKANLARPLGVVYVVFAIGRRLFSEVCAAHGPDDVKFAVFLVF